MASSVILGCNILDHLAFIGFSGWLLCNLSADLIWVWDQVGAASTYSDAILESTPVYIFNKIQLHAVSVKLVENWQCLQVNEKHSCETKYPW